MSSFYAPAATPEKPSRPVTNDGWWPDVDLVQLRERSRLDASVTDTRLRFSVVIACFDVNQQCWEWRRVQEAAGALSLDEVSAPEIDGQSVLVTLYLRAVTCATQVDLIERYRGVDTTAGSDRKADAMDCSVDDLRRDMRWAVNDLIGRSRSTVELI
ncbi:head completion/stabilization protein [Azohydromonas lata]|uniref:Head completion/stabilization protein n=1 Tax=Azohydromonas lata TaxID=45677 RepID=A0ABU5IEP3_9BURK|nr:head completion/stabilization protein [Azohydromonas lata]MDZ5457011.1 head completion/stabilization protein [Azohydromonas lata]